MLESESPKREEVFCCYCSCYVSSPHQCPQSISTKPDMQPYDQARLGQVYSASNLHPNFTRRSGKFGE